MKKAITIILTTILTMAMLAGCTPVASNTVFSIDDLAGKVIGVQLGTTGDICASGYEEDGSVMERFNKGADAVQALKQGKVDCVIIDSEPAKAFVAKNKDLMILDEPFELEEYVCVCKIKLELKGKDKCCDFSVKTDGTLESIISTI